MAEGVGRSGGEEMREMGKGYKRYKPLVTK